MKKTILFAVIFIFFALLIPGPTIFADIGMGGRLDAGLNLFAIPPSEYDSDDDLSVFPIIPLIDAGLSGQFNLGMFNMGIGLRMFSLVVINVFSPTIYVDFNLWRFTLNARITGGAVYIFPLYLVTGLYFFPEASLWYTLNNKKDQLRLGIGAITLLSPQIINGEYDEYRNYIRNFSNNVIFYLAIKVVFPSSWVEW